MVSINNVKYLREDLRKQLPYIIEFNKNTKDYYLLDRDYMYIGYENIKNLQEIEPNLDINDYERIYLYNDGCQPWYGKKYLIKYIDKLYNEQSILNNCKNHNIIILFDFIK
jgi:hypothetical protein